MELSDIRQEQDGSASRTGTQHRVTSIWSLGSGLVSQVPGLGDALGVVGKKSFQKRDLA